MIVKVYLSTKFHIFIYMNTIKFKTKPVRVTFLMDKDLRKKYKQYCIDKDIIMSDRIRELI